MLNGVITLEVGLDPWIYDYVPSFRSTYCDAPNEHQHCEWGEWCTCPCHPLDNDKIGWALPEIEKCLASLEPYLGPYEAGGCNGRTAEWWCAATVVAPFSVGSLDPVVISHALKHQPTRIHRAVTNLCDNGIWEPENGLVHAAWMDEELGDEYLIALTCHVLVAEGKILARPDADGIDFEYCAPRFASRGVSYR